MEELYRGTVLTLYSQVGLYDAADAYAYPEWGPDGLPVVFARKGVAVATAEAIHAEVAVLTGDEESVADGPCFAGALEVGEEGLKVGNEAAATVTRVHWPAGLTEVRVCVNSDDPRLVNKIDFILRMPSEPIGTGQARVGQIDEDEGSNRGAANLPGASFGAGTSPSGRRPDDA